MDFFSRVELAGLGLVDLFQEAHRKNYALRAAINGNQRDRVQALVNELYPMHYGRGAPGPVSFY